MKKGTMQDLVEFIRRREERMDKQFNEKKLREALGHEPWNLEEVYECYLANRSVMEKILQEHDGYKIYAALLEYKSFLNIADRYYQSICDSIDFYKKMLSSSDGGESIFEIMGAASANINVLFWGYATACQALMDAETELQKKHFKGDEKIKGLFNNSFEELLEKNGAHYAVILLRNHLCHGMLTQFNCSYNKNIKEKVEEIRFYMRKEKITALRLDHNTSNKRSIEKNTIGKLYLERDSDLMQLLADHYPQFKKFHETIRDIVKEHCAGKISMCNSYFREIYKYWHGIATYMAKCTGQPAPKPFFPESGTYYLEYAMNVGAGNATLGFKLCREADV